MAPRLTIDASVVAKWFIETGEPDVRIARRLAELAETAEINLYAPDLLLVEIANALHSKSGVSLAAALEAIDFLSFLPTLELIRLEPNVIKQASELAAQTKLSIYDACYVAVSELTDTPLLTADRRLLNSYGKTLTLRELSLSLPESE